MSNRPRPRPERDDDITGLQRPEKFDGAHKFDGTWKRDGAEKFDGVDSLKADGGDVGWKFDGLKGHKADGSDIPTHPKFDGAEEFDGVDSLKADGSDRDGPLKNDGLKADGGDEILGADSLKADGGDIGWKFDGLKDHKADGGGSIDKADGSDEYWIDDEGVLHVAAVETAMPQTPTIDVPELDLGEPAFADSFLDAPVTDFESASPDHGGDELLDS